jgi:hypothetical protein
MVIEKKRATAGEIKAELKRRIEQSTARDGGCRGCEAPTPEAASPRKEGDPNWIVVALPRLADGCFAAILKIVDQARLEYELVP